MGPDPYAMADDYEAARDEQYALDRYAGKVLGYQVCTVSSSVYEVVPTAKKVRRLASNHDPTPRQGPDGQWKEFYNDPKIEEGYPMIFDWDGEGHCTMTSTVFSVKVRAVEV